MGFLTPTRIVLQLPNIVLLLSSYPDTNNSTTTNTRDQYTMEGRNDTAPLGDLGPDALLDYDSAPWPTDPVTQILTTRTNYFGLLLVFIPIITILGNLLVIVSVLRFKALHSAINFLILGLAVADLLVALFVMPYAVYVHVQNGEWFLGALMCDIYMASDVACSTASILLLAVISFDRYRAVSRPIQYSRQAQNIKRVFLILAIIWLISLVVASPMVFGLNNRPTNANPHECRFYNAAFSISSSCISFVIPCILVLFVYIRIMIALKKREQAAKMRRVSQLQQSTTSSSRPRDSIEEEEAGRIVAGPAVNVMMLALPTMSRRMRRFERHRAAIQAAGECPPEDDTPSEPPTPGSRRASVGWPLAALRRPSAMPLAALELLPGAPRLFDATPPESPVRRCPVPDDGEEGSRTLMSMSRSTSTPPNAELLRQEKEIGNGNSSTPRSSVDSLSDNVNVVTNDFVSDVYTNVSSSHKHSSDAAESSGEHSGEYQEKRRSPRKFKNLARNYSTRAMRRRSSDEPKKNGLSSSLSPRGDFIPSIIKQLSMRSPRIFRSAIISKSSNKTEPVVLTNHRTSPCEPRGQSADGERATTSLTVTSLTETETISASKGAECRNGSRLGGIHEAVAQNMSFSRSTTMNSELLGSPENGEENTTFIIENKGAVDGDVAEESQVPQPTVTFSMTVRAQAASPGLKEEDARLKVGSFDEGRRRSEDIVRILTRNPLPETKKEHPAKLPRMDSMCSTDKSRSRNNSLKSVESRNQSVKKMNLAMVRFIDDFDESERSNGGLAVRLVKKSKKHEQSLKSKVSKSQRKEKRATKTLGIVVGIFLVCWLPFFTIQILNGVCEILHRESCQVGFGPFFYTTWIGYMNSFMNPVIYTIFNTEFRRAFKSLIFGRNNRQQFQRQRVHV